MSRSIDLKQIRKYLHRHPECSKREFETSLFIKEKIVQIRSDLHLEHIKERSIVATLLINEQASEHIAFRCELDALPIQEVNSFDHASQKEGVSHKCGHDGHMTILLALIEKTKSLDLKVNLSFIFQSAEETGEGAKEILKESRLLQTHPPTRVFALHNVPGFETNQVVIKSGTLTPSVISCKISLQGKTSHAAQPEKGLNPMFVMSRLLEQLKKLEYSDRNSEEMAIVAPIFWRCGEEAYGTSPGDGEIGFTVRCWTERNLQALCAQIEEIVKHEAATKHIESSIEWFEHFESVQNHLEATKVVQECAANLGMNVLEKEAPFDWGEDFGAFTQQFEGMMFGVGAGVDHPALHHPDYDFPDELIEPASQLFTQILRHYND